ncbi:hypothetical protein [Enterococcus hirae]|uniref:hypothetical protein n=1 Tax=Enterococcus hirae TaxID=1354 RepID=UPI000B9FA4F5|nr:hypothetical protein [Enterococcus hirae]OZS41191.1 hypothetical protein CHB54_00335 [Enterococcus hirae]PWG75719.1 hypothetical protein DF186_10735 [Enterococcus hirae]
MDKQLYWKIDPEKLIDKNVHFNDIELNTKKKKDIQLLCKEYKKITSEIKNIIHSINETNFEINMMKFFEKEAYLAEIYFYLSEDILLAIEDIDILELIKKDYLLSYYWKLEEMNRSENAVLFIKKWFLDKYNTAYTRRFHQTNQAIR